LSGCLYDSKKIILIILYLKKLLLLQSKFRVVKHENITSDEKDISAIEKEKD